MEKLMLIPIFIIVGLIIIFAWVIHEIWWTNYGQPLKSYCSQIVPIIYVNKTALTNIDRCLDYLLSLDYKLLGKNGSYYILNPNTNINN